MPIQCVVFTDSGLTVSTATLAPYRVISILLLLHSGHVVVSDTVKEAHILMLNKLTVLKFPIGTHASFFLKGMPHLFALWDGER